jgi:hypothetical protein
MQGDKPFADMGAMSPRMKALEQSQDMIGYRNFDTFLQNTELPPGHVFLIVFF